jgi:hypothetical protein
MRAVVIGLGADDELGAVAATIVKRRHLCGSRSHPDQRKTRAKDDASDLQFSHPTLPNSVKYPWDSRKGGSTHVISPLLEIT